jgi:ribosomal protein L24E
METRACQHCGDEIPVNEIAYSSNKRKHATAVLVYCSSSCQKRHEEWLGKSPYDPAVKH